MSNRNRKGREINGIVLLDKDSGLSSNSALQKVKKLFFAKKAGHTGSLDPLASGVLPICLGQATKVAGLLLDDDKRYLVRGSLGSLTTTGDCEGEVIETKNFEHISKIQINSVVSSFVGDIEQIPPMYSALKRQGTPLYKLARKGIEVEREPRPVVIHSINFLDYSDGIITLDVKCSKGTYIRTLIEDIGKKLGCGAYVLELRRTGFAHIDISQTIKLADLNKLESDDYSMLDEKIIRTEEMLPRLSSVFLDEKQTFDIKLGRKVIDNSNTQYGQVKMFDSNKKFIGLGIVDSEKVISIKRLFV
jgi:tRNA pseudouridine55 synthase